MLNRYWIIAIVALLGFVLLATLRTKSANRSALYVLAVKLQGGIGLAATLLPTIASVIEEIPERFVRAWERERGRSRLEVVERIRSAS